MIDRNDPRLAKEIVRLREAMGLSKKEFANRLDVSTQSISKWEQGQSRMRRAAYERLTQLAGECPPSHPRRDLVPMISTQVNTTLDHLSFDDIIRGIVNGVKELRKRGFKTEFSVTV